MSSYEFQLPTSCDISRIIDNVELGNLMYIGFHYRESNRVVFKERYDLSWYIKNKNKVKTRFKEFGVIGYLKIPSSKDIYNFFIDLGNVLYTSNICLYGVTEIKSVLKDIHIYGAKSETKVEVLNEIFGVLLKTPVNFIEYMFGKIRSFDVTISPKSIIPRETIIIDGIRVTTESPGRYEVFEPKSNIKVKVLVVTDTIYIIQERFEEELTNELADDISKLISSLRVINNPSQVRSEDSMKDLIEAAPDIYYRGIARHCPVKPIPFTTFESSERCTDVQILYPKENPVLYRAPQGYFINLKINKIRPSGREQKYPVFPCCTESLDKKSNSIYKIYLECKTDDEFKKRIEDYSTRISTPDLLEYKYTGSLYTPLNTLLDPLSFERIRLEDWFLEFGCNFCDISPEEYRKCENNSRLLGYLDTTTLRSYIQEPHHDIRISYHLFENRIERSITIFIKRPRKPLNRFIHTPWSPENKIIIIYEDKGKVCGYETIRKRLIT